LVCVIKASDVIGK
jgi:hypothetical protein